VAVAVEGANGRPDFRRAPRQLKPGDTVWVTDEAQRETRGRIVDLAQSALVLTTDQGLKDLPAQSIARVQQRRSDPLWNGALIGALSVGLPLAIFAATQLTESDDRSNAPAGVLVWSLIGAGAGTGIDAAIRGRKTIYLRPGSPSARVLVSPMLWSTAKGARVSLLF
jgi:hypothetical protein